MKKLHWFFLAVASFTACFVQARQLLYGFDENGFPLGDSFIDSFPLLVVLLIFGAGALLLCRTAPAADDITVDFAGAFDFSGTLPLFLGVCGIFLLFASVVVSLLLERGLLLDTLLACFLALSAAAMFYVLIALRKGRAFPGTVVLTPICYLMLLLVLTYRTWAKDPVRAHYYVPIITIAMLGWSVLQLAAFVFRNGSARSYLPSAMLAVMLSFACALGAQTLYDLLQFAGFAMVHLASLSAFSLKQ